jgi:hypothetical protein
MGALPNTMQHRAFSAAATLLGMSLMLAPRASARQTWPQVPDTPPKASRIALSAPRNQIVEVSGQAGAVSANAWVMLLTLDTGHLVTTQAREDGSFAASIFAPAGTSIMIRSDPNGTVIPAGNGHAAMSVDNLNNFMVALPGTIIRVPDQNPGLANSFAGAAPVRQGSLPIWTFSGSTSARQLSPGAALRAIGTFTLHSATNFPSGRVQVGLMLERLSAADGSPVMANSSWASSTMTATGLPIERLPDWFKGVLVQQSATLDAVSGGFQASVDLTLTLPNDLSHGHYIPCIIFYTDELTEPSPSLVPKIDGANRRPLLSSVYGPVVRVGNPSAPRLAWTLLADDLHNGARGVAAIEDRGRFAMSARMRLPTDFAIVPRLSARTGQPLGYRLEPFAPSISVGDQGVTPNPPFIPFRFPSGELKVTITRPDGGRDVIGPAPFVQSRVRGAGNMGGAPYEFGGHVTDIYQLTTMSPEFEVTFAGDGGHTIALSGFVEDLWGGRWTIDDTFDVRVGRVLTFEPSTLPGTPLTAGDVLNVAGNITPPVPASVTLVLTHSTGIPGSSPTTRTVTTRANRFGFYSVPEPMPVTAAGEYRIDLGLQYADSEGAWYGGRTWGNVVAPPTPSIIAHGRRGAMLQGSGNAAWFVRNQLDSEIRSGAFGFPFHTGDVLWQADHPEGGGVTTLSFQDLAGDLIPLFESRCRPCPLLHLPPIGDFAARAQVGEMPLFSTRLDFADAHIDPSRVDLWAYGYRFSERPAISVREVIGEDSIQTTNWYLLDRYGLQLGNGVEGDRENDFKFQFGGVVLRGAALSSPHFAGYGSLFVVTGEDQNSTDRVMPPFQGNGNGPSGGPLMTLKGKSVDIFLHPTCVRPGTVLERGDNASFCGHVAPLVAATVEIATTAPSGQQTVTRGRANAFGYFNDSASGFRVDEAGVWKAKTKVTFDGILPSTNSQVQPPYPSGDVLGSRDGEFYFYVVERDATPLTVAAMPRFVRPADGPIAFTLEPPVPLSGIEMTSTAVMPGFILDERKSPGLTYIYDAPSLAKDFPNLDLHDDDGRAGVDLITLSFFVSGRDGDGIQRYFARQVVISGEEVLVTRQKATPSSGRRRAIRR